MRNLMKFIVLLTLPRVKSDINDIWKSFETKGVKINRTNLFSQYEKFCPVLNGMNVWQENKDARVQKGDCLNKACVNALYCQLMDKCCHRSPYGYLTISLYDPLVYPEHNSSERYLLVEQCPYDMMDEIKQKCEHTETKPVFSIKTKILYKNLFCARCHGENKTMNMKLELICPDVYRTKTKKFLKDCFIRYTSQNEISYIRLRTSPKVKETSLISRCNETGLWKTFDRDVDWACRHFERSYKQFKNLYCYMCNPTVVSTKPVDDNELINTCQDESQESSEYNQTKYISETNATIAEMCKYSDIVPRFSPYRNAYCLSCNAKYDDYLIDPNIGKLHIISLKNKSPLLKMTLFSENGSFTADTFRKKLEKLLKLFVNNTQEVRIPTEKESGESDRKKRVNIRNKNTLIEVWSKLCPLDKVCTEDYQKVKYEEIKKLCRPLCSCNQSCMLSRELKCCFDQYLTHNVHTCLQESYFPVIMNAEIESSEDLISHRIVDACIHGNEDTDLTQKCHNGEISDYLMNIPVTLNDKTILPFKNIFCLFCNIDFPVEEVIIYLRVQCRNYIEIEIFQTIRHVIQAIKDHQCKVSFALNEHLFKHDKCELDIKTIVQNKLEFICLNDSITKGSGKDVTKMCSSNELLTIVKSISRQYVNCRLCDELTGRETPRTATVIQCIRRNDSTPNSEHMCFVEDYAYATLLLRKALFQVPNDYRSLFTISEAEFKRLRQLDFQKCRQGTYDIKMGICRRLYCSSDRTLVNGSCINMLEAVVNTTFRIHMTLQPCRISDNGANISIIGGNVYNQTINSDKDIEMETDSICKDIYKAIEHIFGNETIYTYVDCHIKVYNCKTKGCGIYDCHTSFNILSISDETRIHINVSVHVKSSSKKSRIEKQLHHLTRKRLFRVKQTVLCPSKRSVVNDNDLCSKQTFTAPYNTDDYKNTVSYNLVKVKKSLFCPLIKIKVTNVLIDKKTRNIGFHFLGADYSVPIDSIDDVKTVDQKSTIWICKNDLKLPNHLIGTNRIDIREVYSLFSTSCNIVSILSLISTLITYSMFKVLRTVPGNNNMNLALCLLLAQASLQFPHVSQTKGLFIQCRAVGIFVHYFWLATFCALNVCSFHMYKVFSGRLMLAQSQLKSVMPKYILYVYGCPFLITLAVVSVNMATSGSIGYGVYRCFLDDLYSVISAFLLPSCFIFISNAIFYGKTFYIIYNSPTLRCNIEERSTVVIYVKLCTITGLTWPLLFIDALFPISVFSFIATFMNAMQGFFIFISFICNRRVWNLYRRSVSGHQEPNTVSNNIDTSLSRAQTLKRSQ